MNILNIGLRLISAGIFITSTLFLALFMPWLLVITIPIAALCLQGINVDVEDE